MKLTDGHLFISVLAWKRNSYLEELYLEANGVKIDRLAGGARLLPYYLTHATTHTSGHRIPLQRHCGK